MSGPAENKDIMWFYKFIADNTARISGSLIISLEFLLYFLESRILTRYMIAKICSLPLADDRVNLFLRYLAKRNPDVAPKRFAEAMFLSKQQCLISSLDLGHYINDNLQHCSPISLKEKPLAVKRFEQAAVENDRLDLDRFVFQYYFNQSYGFSAKENFYLVERGLCVIINNSIFEGNAKMTRHGSELDVNKCEDTFRNLGYAIMKFENLSEHGFKETFTIVRKSISDCGYDHLVLIVMSHGVDRHVIASDHKLLDFYFDICAKFTSRECPSLGGLPKIFLIQACQIVVEGDCQRLVNREDAEDYRDYSFADMASFVATAPGSAASRYLPNPSSGPFIRPGIEFGSHFINRFCELIREWGHILTINEIQLEVNAYVEQVSLELSGSNQISNGVLYTLTKNFMFRHPF